MPGDRSAGFCRVLSRQLRTTAAAMIFELEIGLPDGHKRRERVHVTVTKSSSAGEGI